MLVVDILFNNKIYLRKLRTFEEPNKPQLLVNTPKYKNLFSLTLNFCLLVIIILPFLPARVNYLHVYLRTAASAPTLDFQHIKIKSVDCHITEVHM